MKNNRFSKGSKHGKGIPQTNPWSLGLRISRIWFESHTGLLASLVLRIKPGGTHAMSPQVTWLLRGMHSVTSSLTLPFLRFGVQRQILRCPPKNTCNIESQAEVNLTAENADFVTLLDREELTLKALVQPRCKPWGYRYLGKNWDYVTNAILRSLT